MEFSRLAVIFDMDGVLVDSEHLIRSVCIDSLRRFGVNPSHEDFFEFTGMGEDAFIGGVARKHGLVYDLEMKDYAYSLYVQRAGDELVVFPGVRDVLLSLHTSGYTLCIASAADLIKVKANLSCIGVDESIFAAVVSGSEITHKKPDPEIFLAAAKKAGVQPAMCMVVEDAISGVKAAKAAGMSCIGVQTSFKADELLAAGADDTVAQTQDILDVVAKWKNAFSS